MAEVKKSWWDRLGSGLATVAKYAAKGALWASEHPEVIAQVANISGHPEVGYGVGVGASAVVAIEKAHEKK